MNCPKCGYEQPDGEKSCGMCGIIFERFFAQELEKVAKSAPDSAVFATQVSQIDEDEVVKPLMPDKEALLHLSIGLGIVLVVYLFPLLRFIFDTAATLIHEFGHSITAWIFGYPSIPAFDLMHGGGVAIWFSRETGLLVLYYLAFLGLTALAAYKRRIMLAVVTGIFTAVYSLFAFTSLHEIAMIFMGHGTELVFGGLFLYRALSGSAIVTPLERPLYAALGIYFFSRNTIMGLKLASSESYRYIYTEAKGGDMRMDLNLIGEDHLNMSLSSTASLFVLACIFVFVASLVVYRYWRYIHCWIIGLF